MPIFNFDDEDSDVPIPTWTPDQIQSLESINPFYVPGIVNLLKFLVHEKGTLLDSVLDLTFVLHSVANMDNSDYTLSRTDGLVAIASEFCLIDCLYDGSVLAGIEMLDNAVLFLALNDQANFALEAAVCLKDKNSSIMQTSAVLPSLSLFGHWEEFASTVLACLLTNASTSSKMSTLFKVIKHLDIGVNSEIEFVDHIRKLCAVNLLSLNISESSDAVVSINHQPAGLFLLFSNQEKLARRLAELSI